MSGNKGRKRGATGDDGSGDKVGRPSPYGDSAGQRKSMRIRKKQAERLSELRAHFPKSLRHFGEDVTSAVESGTSAGGKLSELEREEVRRKVVARRVTGPTLKDVLPEAFVPQVEETFRKGGVIQRDMRVDPGTSQTYGGEMFTSTFANPPSGGGDKEIPRPSSPRPSSFAPGLVHAAHTAPFSVGGPETNRTKTVNAPQTANLVVDSFLEKQVIAAHKVGDEAVHARLDTNNRSTVIAVTKTDTGYSSMAAQYGRRPGSL